MTWHREHALNHRYKTDLSIFLHYTEKHTGKLKYQYMLNNAVMVHIKHMKYGTNTMHDNDETLLLFLFIDIWSNCNTNSNISHDSITTLWHGVRVRFSTTAFVPKTITSRLRPSSPRRYTTSETGFTGSGLSSSRLFLQRRESVCVLFFLFFFFLISQESAVCLML